VSDVTDEQMIWVCNDPGVTMAISPAIAKIPERRRSARASVCVDLIICGEGGEWQERTCTLSANVHGVLVALGSKVKVNQRVVVRNVENLAERQGRVIRLGRGYGHRREVAIEFTEPAQISLMKPHGRP
jgi:hypothetical protein